MGLREFGDKIIERIDDFIDRYEAETARRAAAEEQPTNLDTELVDLLAQMDENDAIYIGPNSEYSRGATDGYRDGYLDGVADTEKKYDAKPEAASDRGDFPADETGPAIEDWAVRPGESLSEVFGRIAGGLRP